MQHLGGYHYSWSLSVKGLTNFWNEFNRRAIRIVQEANMIFQTRSQLHHTKSFVLNTTRSKLFSLVKETSKFP